MSDEGAGREFATRLSRAVAERGVSLHGLRADLRAGGLDVSVATLSYWSTGRSLPTRGRSLEVVQALESLLGLPPDHLAGVARRRDAQHGEQVLPHADALTATLARLQLDNSSQRSRLAIHDTNVIGTDRTEREVLTRQLLRAEVDGIDAWPVVVETMPGQEASVEGLGGVTTDPPVPVPGTEL